MKRLPTKRQQLIEMQKYYYVYKLRVHGHRHHYIGVTCNYFKRKDNHFRGIADMLNKIRYGFSVTDKECASAYYFMAYKIWITYKVPSNPKWLSIKDIENYVYFDIIKKSKYIHIIKKHETLYINKAGSFSLNKSVTSSYYGDDKV